MSGRYEFIMQIFSLFFIIWVAVGLIINISQV